MSTCVCTHNNMNNRSRRGRRGRSAYRHLTPPPRPPPPQETSRFLEVAKNVAFTVGVICIVYMMMQYNCKHCYTRKELSKLASSVDEIAKHLDTISNNYELLESTLMIYSRELPKLEVEMAALEQLAHTLKASGDWNPVRHSLPYVDAHVNKLNKSIQNIKATRIRNSTKTTKKHIKVNK